LAQTEVANDFRLPTLWTLIGRPPVTYINCCILVGLVCGNPVFADVRFAAPNFWLFVDPENQNLGATRAIGKNRFQPKVRPPYG
jgi:hypothetical protein